MQPARSAAPVQSAVPEPPAVRHLGSVSAAAMCGCGHGRTAHEHYRRGSDCAFCDCLRYLGHRTRLRNLFTR